MYFQIDGGTGSYTTSTTNMYNKDFTYRRTEQTHPGIQRMASFGQTEVPGGQGFGRQASGVRPSAVFRTVDQNRV